MFNPFLIKQDFPIFKRAFNGKPLCYLDSAATSQKPRVMIEALQKYYETMNANVHRGIHFLSEEATLAYEKTRDVLVSFINAQSSKEIVFTKNCTEAINLISYCWGRQNIREGDEIIVSALEHHSNLVPWQELAKEKKARLLIIPLTADLGLDYTAYEQLLSNRTKLVAVSAMSNVLGTIVDVKRIIRPAHAVGARVLVDAAQAAPHLKIDVQELDCDFLAFSAHKMLGPTGVGILYAKESILESMPPFLFGGDMVSNVQQYVTDYNELPWKFEAGTQNIADIIAFQASLDYLGQFDMRDILKHDRRLSEYAFEKFSKHKQVQLFYPKNKEERGGVLSFAIDGVHPHDIASIFNEFGIAIRSGHHCAQPLHEYCLKVPATARLSFYIYNTEEDVERAEKALNEVLRIFNIN